MHCQDENNNVALDENVIKKFEDGKDDKSLFMALKGLMEGNGENDLASVNLHLDVSGDMIHQVHKTERFLRPLLDIVSENNVPKKEIKVLELNLSKAIMAEQVDQHLALAAIYPIDVDYTLAVEAIDKVPDEYKNKSFKLIEWNPKKQLFPNDLLSINLIVLRDSHQLWTLDVRQQLQEMNDSLIANGFLLSVFRCKLTEPEATLNRLIGNEIEDKELDLRIKEFSESAKVIGFSLVGTKTDSIGYTAMLFRKTALKTNKKLIQSIHIGNKYEQWFEMLKNKMIQFKELDDNDPTRLWLIANDSISGLIGLVNSLRVEPGGDRIRCILDYDKLLQVPLNSTKNPMIEQILANDLAINVIKGGKLGTFRHLTLPKDYDKTLANDYFLNLGQTKDLSSLQWFSSKNLFLNKKTFDINNKEVRMTRCKVYTSGLNFKDVMFATGKSTEDLIEEKLRPSFINRKVNIWSRNHVQ